jgi:hypothetical protein
VAQATTYNLADCNYSTVNTAVNTTAANGDTVTLPDCSVTWDTSLSIPNTKGITLRGVNDCTLGTVQSRTNIPTACGTNITFGTCTSTSNFMISVADGNATTRVAHINFNLGSAGSCSGGSFFPKDNAKFWIYGGVSAAAFRLDHLMLSDCGGRCIQTWGTGTADLRGLIDHLWIESPDPGGSGHPFDFNGQNGESDGPFARAVSFGSDQYVYVEDTVIDMVDIQDGCFDAYGGTRFVLRNSTCINSLPSWHGADSGNRRGIHSFEMYRNNFTITGTSVFTAYNTRSGVGLFWSNVWSSGYNDQGRMTLYRVTISDTYPPWGMCTDGNHAWDGNTSPTGYPCLDQFGWIFDENNTGTRTLTPIYMWLNTRNGSALGNPITSDTYVTINREFYTTNGASCTSGGACTTGIGTGTSLPTTCTTGVGYWKTDEGNWDSVQAGTDGVLYKCTSTNTWTLYYTPYTYPHPLQNASSTSVLRRFRFLRRGRDIGFAPFLWLKPAFVGLH